MNNHEAKPCPNCGHCPTCGHTPLRSAPFVPWYPYVPTYPSPWWGVYPPNGYWQPIVTSGYSRTDLPATEPFTLTISTTNGEGIQWVHS